MTIKEAMKTFRLPNPTTPEYIGCRWTANLKYGDKIVLAGCWDNGPDKPCYYGATYEFTTDDHTCEGPIELRAVSDVAFNDNGSAIYWAMQQ